MATFGCCLSIASFVPQMGGAPAPQSDVLQQLEAGLALLAGNGYDFAELTVGTVAGLTEEQMDRAAEIVRNSGIPVPVLNSFIPPKIPLTGPDVSMEQIESYVRLVMPRVRRIGGDRIIFGSGGARKVPERFPMEKAMEQIADFLRLCEQVAAENDIVVAIEPLNKGETNIIHTVAEGCALAGSLGLPHIQVLADSYHMFLERESFEVLTGNVERLAHVHIADKDRLFPGIGGEGGVDFADYFRTLKAAGYDGTISAECKSENLRDESARSLAYVKQLWAAV